MNKKMNLKNGFLPLQRNEMCEIHGGIFLIILAGLTIAAGAEIFSDWDNFKAGLMGRPEIK